MLGPAGNQARSVELRKPIVKPKSVDTQKPPEAKGNMSPEKIRSPVGSRENAGSAASILRQRQPNLSMNASCSSDASTESSHSRASTGRISRRSANSETNLKRKPQCSSRGVKFESDDGSLDGSLVKERCTWVTSNTGMLLHITVEVRISMCGVNEAYFIWIILFQFLYGWEIWNGNEL